MWKGMLMISEMSWWNSNELDNNHYTYIKSLIAKLQNRYHVSAAEIDEQDTHQIIVIGVAAIVPHNAMADSLMDDISLFVEENTEAEIIDEEREIR